MTEYYVKHKRATKINAEGLIRWLERKGESPILIIDPEAKDQLYFLIALPKEAKP